MREKELRVALVCFGGVSLAVYMHGITKEVLKLVRASRALHDIKDRGVRVGATFPGAADPADPEFDTEEFYFELLRDIGRKVELRVIVDIIAGASAGGINGAMLARALAHDLPMQKLRELWLDNADVSQLLSPEARATQWSKWFMRPVLWAASLAGYALLQDAEVRANLSLFVRSRWFRPPLSGHRMAGLMYDAITAMGAPRGPHASLLPSGLRLDLFVTLTDFYGYQQPMQIHNPPIIYEREHRHLLQFGYRRQASGAMETDFDLANAPSLAFAARATSSFPGAFPPARLVEMDELLTTRGAQWPRRQEFLSRNFEHYRRANVDATTVSFIDGSVLNNRPFREAIGAIRGRPAYREVDRRVVYIDPDPAQAGAPMRYAVPGFFATLKGAVSDIPLAQPIADELKWIVEFNERARRLNSIVDSARPHIDRLVADVTQGEDNHPLTPERIRVWRERANAEAMHDAGFAYDGYVRLKLAAVRSLVSQLIANLRGLQPHSPFARAIIEIVEAWATQTGVTYAPADMTELHAERPQGTVAMPRWVKFLLAFDLEYRERRLNFLIQGQNRLYERARQTNIGASEHAAADEMKRRLYGALEALQQRKTACCRSPETVAMAEALFRTAPSPAEMKNVKAYAEAFVKRHSGEIDRLIERLTADTDLQASTHDIDEAIAAIAAPEWSAESRRETLVNYLGFPFWDALTFPVMTWREAGEFNEIAVDRISPLDALSVAKLGAPQLKGTAFDHFAAFLSRGYRENDYLLGRLQGLDRLIDIVADAAGIDARIDPAMLALKERAFLRILDAEEAHLPQSKAMIAQLRALIAEGRMR